MLPAQVPLGIFNASTFSVPALNAGAMITAGIVPYRNDTLDQLLLSAGSPEEADPEEEADPGGHLEPLHGAGRKLAARRSLATLLRERLRVVHRRGTGPGRHAYWRTFKNAPFPLFDGCVVSFDIRFERGFEWGCRGKIGGLFIGPGQADGGKHSRDGASFRVMWDSRGSAYGYVYVPTGSEYLQPPELARRAPKGQDILKDKFSGVFGSRWRTVELGLKLNSFSRGRPNRDGQLMLSVDGRTQRLKGVVWRLRKDISIDAFTLGLFHGGPCSATRTSYSDVRNVVVYPW